MMCPVRARGMRGSAISGRVNYSLQDFNFGADKKNMNNLPKREKAASS